MELESVKNALKSNEQTFAQQLRNKIFTDFMLENNQPKVEETKEETAE